MFPGIIATAAAILLLFVEAGPARSQSHRPFAVKTPDGINISAQEWGNPNGREIGLYPRLHAKPRVLEQTNP
jgi:non-heme chloroperoxidase